MSHYSTIVLQDRPVAYWRLDETSGSNVVDSSGNGINGVVAASNSGVTIAQPGLLISDPSDDCMQFLYGGTFQGLDITKNTSLLNVDDIFTIEAWVELTSLNGTTSIISLGSGAGYIRTNSDNTLHLLCSQIADMVGSTVSLSLNKIYHCVATKNGSTIHLYLNGMDVTGSISNATCGNSGTGAISIGGTDDGFPMGWPGFIDEVAVYSYALTPTQVLNHYNAGAFPYVGPPRTPIPQSRMATTNRSPGVFLIGISDNFNRANENPLSDGGLWTTPPSYISSTQLQVISNQLTGQNTGGFHADANTWVTPFVDPFEATIDVIALVAPSAFASIQMYYTDSLTSVVNGYIVAWYFTSQGYGYAQITPYVGGSGLTTQTSVTFNIEPGDRLGLRVINQVASLWTQPEGDGIWIQRITASGPPSITGYLSFVLGYSSGTTWTLDNWRIGNPINTPTRLPSGVRSQA